jgi:hypothetical protein
MNADERGQKPFVRVRLHSSASNLCRFFFRPAGRKKNLQENITLRELRLLIPKAGQVTFIQ